MTEQSMCEHNYVYMRNDSFAIDNTNHRTYVSIDYFFCSKCLHEEVKEKRKSVLRGHTIPDWAQNIKEIKY